MGTSFAKLVEDLKGGNARTEAPATHNYILNRDRRPTEARLIFDLKCNSGCAHCCENSGLYRTEKMEDDVFRKVADSLSSYKIPVMVFSGGESTMDFERLISSVKYLRKEAGYSGKVVVQTNAHWASSEEGAEKVLLELKDAGVDSLDIPSIDRYHEANFKANEYATRAGRIANELGLGAQKRSTPEKLKPIGRAKRLPRSEWDLDGGCTVGVDDITIDTKGNVYPCCWHQTPPIGNITEKPLEDIIGGSRKNPLLVEMAKQWFEGVPSEMLGITEDEKASLLEEWGRSCGACSEYYSRHRDWPKP